MNNNNQELENFKKNINLIEYALSKGFSIDQKKTTNRSALLSSDFDKIIVSKDANGAYIYFSVHDNKNSGTIIDFVQNYFKKNLGQVRQELRSWSREYVPQYKVNVEKKEKFDAKKIKECFSDKTPIIKRHKYLNHVRKIDNSIIQSPRFINTVYTDNYQNAIFPHYDLKNLRGWEIKNNNFTGFSKGGTKGLYKSNFFGNDNKLIIAESGIDVLSHHALKPYKNARYISLAGALSPVQLRLVILEILQMPIGSQIVFATDHDDGGQNIIDKITQAISTDIKNLYDFQNDQPPTIGLDWNRILVNK